MERELAQVAMGRQGVIGRRHFLRTIGLGAAGAALPLTFTDWMAVHADEMRKHQRACILLWMSGGPSQLETFDPKPGTEHGGETNSIKTAVPGIEIANGWDHVARAMKDVALVRSMTNKEGNHQRATYQLHTGYVPSATIKHPHIGCSVASELGESHFDLPHLVSIGGPTIGAGFLGAALEPFVVSRPEKPPENVAPRVATTRFQRRMGLLDRLEHAGFENAGGADQVRDHRALYAQTARMVLSPRMKAFDLEAEPGPLRDAYGRTAFGQGCLLARRLIEAGVTFVEVRSTGWDTHQQNHERVGKLAGQVGPAFAALIEDLKGRGLLENTLVLWMGEFGRTPKINATAGRDHFPKVFNVALAGGGVKGGQAIGSSTADGSDVRERPVHVTDLLSTVCHALKVNATREVITPIGRPIRVVDAGKPITELFG